MISRVGLNGRGPRSPCHRFPSMLIWSRQWFIDKCRSNSRGQCEGEEMFQEIVGWGWRVEGKVQGRGRTVPCSSVLTSMGPPTPIGKHCSNKSRAWCACEDVRVPRLSPAPAQGTCASHLQPSGCQRGYMPSGTAVHHLASPLLTSPPKYLCSLTAAWAGASGAACPAVQLYTTLPHPLASPAPQVTYLYCSAAAQCGCQRSCVSKKDRSSPCVAVNGVVTCRRKMNDLFAAGFFHAPAMHFPLSAGNTVDSKHDGGILAVFCRRLAC